MVYSEEELWAQFKESCEAEAEEPDQHTEGIKRATEDLFQMSERKKNSPEVHEGMTALPSSAWRSNSSVTSGRPLTPETED